MNNTTKEEIYQWGELAKQCKNWPGVDKWGWRHIKRWPNPDNKTGYKWLIVQARPICNSQLVRHDEISGPCLRSDDFTEMNSRRWLEVAGFGFGSMMSQISLINDWREDQVIIQCLGKLPTELEYFKAIVETGILAWEKNLPDWQEIWNKAQGIK